MAKKPAKAADEKLAAPERKPRKKKPAPVPEKKARKQLTTAEWRKIRTEYIKGKTTYAKLAEKYNISPGHIRKRASLEGWTKKKRNLDTMTEQKALARLSDARAEELVRLARIADKVDDILDSTLDAIAKIKPEGFEDMRGMESLTRSVQIAVQTKRDLYNLPNDIDRAKIESLREKSRLEREKYEAEKAEKAQMQQEASQTLIRVVVEDASSVGAMDE